MDPIGIKVLEDLKKSDDLFKDAFIAGGFLRDSLLGGTFKDIDIFIPILDNKELYATPRILKNYGNLRDLNLSGVLSERVFETSYAENNFQFIDVKFEKYGNSELKTTLTIDFRYMKSIPVQLIFYVYKEDPYQELMDSFDFSINKIYSKDDEVVVSKEAEADIRNSVATLCHADSMNSYMISYERFTRWKIKYPRLTFVSKTKFYTEKDISRIKKEVQYYYESRIKLLEEQLKSVLGQAAGPLSTQSSGAGGATGQKYYTDFSKYRTASGRSQSIVGTWVDEVPGWIGGQD